MTARHVAAETKIGRLEPERPGGFGDITPLPGDLGKPRKAKARSAVTRPIDLDRTGNDADALFEPEGGRACFAVAVQKSEKNRGADRRMPGKGQFANGGEDAQLRPAVGVLGGQHEHRLRQVELASRRLHGLLAETFGVQHHGQRVASMASSREDIERDETAWHRAAFTVSGLELRASARWLKRCLCRLDGEAPGWHDELVLRRDGEDLARAGFLGAFHEAVH